VPTILQQEAVECGAACLAMVLGYHGLWMSLERLREECGVNRDGTKATNIVRAAREVGMIAKGLRKEVDALPGLPLPQIVFWNFNHFVVVEGYALTPEGGHVWINDPASGPRPVSRQEFDTSFTGVVLAFQRGPEFRPAGSRTSVASIIRARLSGYRSVLGGAALAGAVLLVPGIVSAGFTGIFVDHILVAGQSRWLPYLVGAMLAVAVLRAGISYVQARILARGQIALAAEVSAKQMWQILHLPLGFFSQRYPGDIANRFNLIDRFGGTVFGGLAPSAISLLSIIGYGAALYFIDPVLGGVASMVAVLALLTLSVSVRGLADAGRRQISQDAALQGATIQGLSMIEDFRVSGTEGSFLARWSGYQAQVLDAEHRANLRSNTLSEASSLVTALGGVAVLIVGGVRVIDGALSIGSLIAFQMLMGGFFGPVLGLVRVGGQLQSLRGIGERLDDIVRYAEGARDKAPPPAAAPTGAPTGRDLTLENIDYRFGPADPMFIQGLSLDIRAGERIALVGPSGSGKSTLGRMIVGLAQPTGGTIRLGGLPLAEWPQAELRGAIAYVEQQVGLFSGTIRDNLTLWDETIAEQRVFESARLAAAHDFITARQGGYDARMASGGGNFSGGERQRLAIARALAVEPSLLVLDEATSALDAVAEQQIMDNIRRLGCTCVIVAHRLSSIRECDRILVMERGRIVECGTHGELVASGGLYRSLVEH
jgi:NHLM bacteriocin system ABC transporter peptidase/ATP-binding protein